MHTVETRLGAGSSANTWTTCSRSGSASLPLSNLTSAGTRELRMITISRSYDPTSATVGRGYCGTDQAMAQAAPPQRSP